MEKESTEHKGRKDYNVILKELEEQEQVSLDLSNDYIEYTNDDNDVGEHLILMSSDTLSDLSDLSIEDRNFYLELKEKAKGLSTKFAKETDLRVKISVDFDYTSLSNHNMCLLVRVYLKSGKIQFIFDENEIGENSTETLFKLATNKLYNGILDKENNVFFDKFLILEYL